MLVYRVVPGYWGTRLTSGYIATPPEDAFYDLGYLNMNNGCPYFNMGSGLDAVNSFDYVEEDCKYFYLFPWDALLNSKYIGNIYSDMEISILEYDIPQDILIECLGFGYYDGCHIPEFQIPTSKLRNNNPIFQKCDDELFNQLLGAFQKRAQMFFEKIRPFLMQQLNDQEISQQRYEQIEKNMHVSSQAELLNLYESRLNNLDTFFKCEYITGRYTLFFGEDLEDIRYREDIKAVINDSLPFFTNDTYQKWMDYWEATKNHQIVRYTFDTLKEYIIQNYLQNDRGRILQK